MYDKKDYKCSILHNNAILVLFLKISFEVSYFSCILTIARQLLSTFDFIYRYIFYQSYWSHVCLCVCLDHATTYYPHHWIFTSSVKVVTSLMACNYYTMTGIWTKSNYLFCREISTQDNSNNKRGGVTIFVRWTIQKYIFSFSFIKIEVIEFFLFLFKILLWHTT